MTEDSESSTSRLRSSNNILHEEEDEVSQSSSSDDSDSYEPLNLNADTGESVGLADEELNIISFFGESDGIFSTVEAMFEHCHRKHDLDFIKLVKEHELDDLGAIKLVNYIRAAYRDGREEPLSEVKDSLTDDTYLQPTIENDALLYSLGDVLSLDREEMSHETTEDAASSPSKGFTAADMVREQLDHARAGVSNKDSQISPADGAEQEHGERLARINASQTKRAIDDEYFSSYADTQVHETMLRDSIRTDAYRDFIYNNKALFADKIILDVGCGTGILSLFAAKSGASKVIAVDNSDIITKAREIVRVNNTATINCVRGDVTELVHHPDSILKKPVIDIIVSEWMGYCLLFEAMLDSVIKARDLYLAPTGLMAPSHVTLRIAPVSDATLVDECVTFWSDVYGFDYTPMLPTKQPQDVIIRHLPSSSIPAASRTFKTLNLHNCSVADLEFTQSFSTTLVKAVDSLDAFAIWFDTFFSPSRDADLAPTANTSKPLDCWLSPHDVNAKGETSAFTTGPAGKATHWGMGICLIDRWSKGGGGQGRSLPKDAVIEGEIGYAKVEQRPRELKIVVRWRVLAPGGDRRHEGGESKISDRSTEVLEEGTQTWMMR